jgi:hypothetical protein
VAELAAFFDKSYPVFLSDSLFQDKASLQATVERLTVDIGVLRSDNMNLFEKIKFLEAFHRSNGGGGGAASGATGVAKVWSISNSLNSLYVLMYLCIVVECEHSAVDSSHCSFF